MKTNKDNYRALYIHGYMGQENGNASRLVRKELEDRNLPIILDAPSFPVTEREKMHEMLKKLQEENQYDFAIASSLGAFYTMQADFPTRILVNTAMPKDLRAIKESDPAGNPLITEEFLVGLEQDKKAFFENVKIPEWKENTLLIYGTEDTVAHSKDLLEPLADGLKIYHIPMEHRMSEVGAKAIGEILGKMC